MNGHTVLARLERLCRELDLGLPLTRIEWGRALAPVAVGIVLGVAGCTSCASNGSEPVPAYAAPLPPTVELVCSDAVDDDVDGLVDCLDPDCVSNAACTAVDMYGAPMAPQREQDCANQVDDDRDGVADCSDSDCIGVGLCAAVAAYASPAMPPMESVCSGGMDEDQDGLADCADPDCAASEDCRRTIRYGGPFPR
jgi:hypothetical protein